MFTKENPCSSPEDLERFASWWSMYTGIDREFFETDLDIMRDDVFKGERAIRNAQKDPTMLTRDDRAKIGVLQEALVLKKAKLVEVECAHPMIQPEMILLVPRVEGFAFSTNYLVITTETLYGRDHRKSDAPWCEIGRQEITITSNICTGIVGRRSLAVHWTNVNGNKTVTIFEKNKLSVPAPQIQADGRRGCMGVTVTNIMNDSNAKGRLDMAIAVILRFTEHPLVSGVPDGLGMGDFPAVPDDQVPEFYLKSFPR